MNDLSKETENAGRNCTEKTNGVKSRPNGRGNVKIYTTNYQNTFIEIAEDCPVKKGEIPPEKKTGKTVANLQYEILSKNPYEYTSDDVLFECFAIKNNVPESELKSAREQFFSKGQPCFRASPLTKQYGWGVHSNGEGKIAIYGCETSEYKKYSNESSLKILKAMRAGK
jgi:hypothetical protein